MTGKPERDYDIVLMGATGFTGGLTARYLAQHAPQGCRWAIAGRSTAKLEGVRARLALPDLPIVVADSADPKSLQELASSTRVVISTVGPYVLHGAELVAACAATGTDYVDLTGEPEFVDEMYLRHHAQAQRSGARLVHSCGFDSIPHDLGVFFTVNHLPEQQPITISGLVWSNATFSAGTLHSALTAFSRGRQTIATAKRRRQAEPRLTGRKVHTPTGRPHRVSHGWAVPLPTIDPQVVARSARALQRYGPDFTYSHFAQAPSLVSAVGAGAGVGALIAAVQIPPVRRAILSRFPAGEGPSQQRRERSRFSVTFTATAGDTSITTRVSGGDPGYDETSKMLAESALCLAFDDLPELAGQLTTAVALGQPLVDRLVAAGMSFQLL